MPSGPAAVGTATDSPPDAHATSPTTAKVSAVSLKRLASESVIYGLAKIVDPMIGFLLLPIVTAILRPSDFGLINLFTAISAVVFTFGSLGIHQAFLRFFTEDESTPVRAKLLGTSLMLAIGYWLFWWPLGIAAAKPFARILFESSQPALIYALLAIGFVETIDSLGCNALQASGRAKSYLVSTLAGTFSIRGLALAFILGGAGAWGWILGEAIGRVIAMVVIAMLVFRQIRPRIDFGRAKTMAIYGGHLVPAMLSFYVMGITDKLLIRWLLPNWSEAIGFYAVGERIAAIMHLANMAIILGWQRFAFQNMHHEGGGQMIARGLRLYVILAGLALTALITLGDDLLWAVIHPSFAPGFKIIIPLTIAAFLGGLANLCDVGLHRSKRPGLISVITTMAAVVNIAANFAMIPRFGIAGAAYATVLSQLFRLIVVFAASQKMFRLPMRWPAITMAIAAYGGVFFIANQFERGPLSWSGPWLEPIAQSAVLLAATASLPWWPVWSDDDRQAMKTTLRKAFRRSR